ncbi:hypothetical protein BMW22_06525 [Rhizobium leguminosarum]|uniref:Guanylate cyclase domain-containing protein n=1 Tax=Rhizobium leguminosarum TaxID=384 RepID=A0A1L3Z6P0_RHILE|nr:hypothetical protein BMW22_06525 [Rhizobium leguminosarum]
MESDVRQRENLATAPATVAFIDIGFSAIADVYGDAAALDVLEVFESMVRDALSGYDPPIKWIGDEAMLSFPEPDTAIQVLGPLLQACRKEPRLPLTRTGLNHGPASAGPAISLDRRSMLRHESQRSLHPANCSRPSPLPRRPSPEASWCGTSEWWRLDRWRGSPSL